jgi:hypothetical protein
LASSMSVWWQSQTNLLYHHTTEIKQMTERLLTT